MHPSLQTPPMFAAAECPNNPCCKHTKTFLEASIAGSVYSGSLSWLLFSDTQIIIKTPRWQPTLTSNNPCDASMPGLLSGRTSTACGLRPRGMLEYGPKPHNEGRLGVRALRALARQRGHSTMSGFGYRTEVSAALQKPVRDRWHLLYSVLHF